MFCSRASHSCDFSWPLPGSATSSSDLAPCLAERDSSHATASSCSLANASWMSFDGVYSLFVSRSRSHSGISSDLLPAWVFSMLTDQSGILTGSEETSDAMALSAPLRQSEASLVDLACEGSLKLARRGRWSSPVAHLGV